MKTFAVGLISALIIILANSSCANDTMTPHEILERNFEATMGSDYTERVKTTHSKGTISMPELGLEGTLLSWSGLGLRRRQVLSFPDFTQVSGDNGKFHWGGMNDEIMIDTSELDLATREVAQLMADNQHFARDSKVFQLQYFGIEKVNSYDCYVVEIRDTITSKILTGYYDTTSYFERRMISKSPNLTLDTYNSDFRLVGGCVYPFRSETTALPAGIRSVILTTELVFNVPVHDSIFEPPSKSD